MRRLPLLILAAALLCGCKDPHADMGDQDKYNTYEPSTFFADGSSARPLVAGVVPRDADVGAARFTELAAPDATIPFPITGNTILRGQKSFEIFCAPCHGRLGNGEGMIVQRGFTRPPSFHIDRLKQAPDAHFYNVITQGYGAMFSYNDRIAPQQRWEIVAYLRALQMAPEAAGGSVSDRDQQALIAGGDRPAPTTQGGAR